MASGPHPVLDQFAGHATIRQWLETIHIEPTDDGWTGTLSGVLSLDPTRPLAEQYGSGQVFHLVLPVTREDLHGGAPENEQVQFRVLQAASFALRGRGFLMPLPLAVAAGSWLSSAWHGIKAVTAVAHNVWEKVGLPIAMAASNAILPGLGPILVNLADKAVGMAADMASGALDSKINPHTGQRVPTNPAAKQTFDQLQRISADARAGDPNAIKVREALNATIAIKEKIHKAVAAHAAQPPLRFGRVININASGGTRALPPHREQRSFR